MATNGHGERCNASDMVQRQVTAGRGEATAVVAQDATLTYDQLRRQINRMAGVLRELGVTREQRVLLVLDDTSLFPITFLAAMRIGAVPVAVSPLDKDDNFRHFVDDSYAELVVTDAASLERLTSVLGDRRVRWLVRGASGDSVVEVDDAMSGQSDELDAVATHRDDMAFWLYSSGSTGKPKGVVHLHHDIGVTCENYARQVLGLSEADITFSTTKLFHAYGLGNGLSFPLWFGATAVLVPGPSKPQPILDALRRHRPTVFFSVPALFGAIVADPAAEGALESVRFCVSAAEALPPNTIKRWRDRFGVDIVDGIGSTEMLHIYCSNRPGRVAPGTTGWPVPGYELRLVDDRGDVLEGETVGALQVRGDSCAAYYWHQHEKSKSSMLGDWFATGDRYERREDGTYTYVGRIDDMLKVGGLWVSPLDMEHTLIEHPRVGAVGVVGVTQAGTSRIAAYIQCAGAPGDDALAEELRAWCKERMRRYEYPHVVKFVDDLPRTLTGKVQRFRLREWAAEVAAREPEAVRVEAIRGWAWAPRDLRPHRELSEGAALRQAVGERHRRTVGVVIDAGGATRHPGVLRRAGDGRGHLLDDCAIEHAGNDVVGVELVLADDSGDRLGGGELHVLVDRAGADVERAAENSGEGQHVVDLVRVVRAPRGHDRHVGADLLGANLRHRIGHGEDDRPVGHGAHGGRRHRAGAGDADQHIGARQQIIGHASQPVRIRGRRQRRPPLIKAGAPGIEGAIDIAHDDVAHPVGEHDLGTRQPGRTRAHYDDSNVRGPLVDDP